VIHLLDQRSELLEWLGERAEINQLLELDAQARSLALPNEEATGTLLRYETHLHRHSIAPWTNWSAGNGVVREKMYLRRST